MLQTLVELQNSSVFRGLVFLFFYGLVILPLEKKWSRDKNTKDPEFFFDVRNTIFYFIAVSLTLPPVIIWLTSLAPTSFFIPFSNSLLQLPLFFQILLALIVFDFIFYWVHRFSHANSFLWLWHESHHDPKRLHALVVFRVHFIGTILHRAPPYAAMALLGFSPLAILGVTLVHFVMSFFFHMDTKLRFGVLEKIITTPHFHLWHHDLNTQGKNLSLVFPVIDWIFGTYYLPDHSPKELGLPQKMPSSLIYHQTRPFIKLLIAIRQLFYRP
jgi:sterol desaturase/sphingolipid hydroxylase (fatty acid hydroxylase superfamily)